MNETTRPENLAFLAREYLTWLWFEAQRGGGSVHLAGFGDVRIDFARRLNLLAPGVASETTAVAADLPTLANEARVALQTGKKVASTTLLLDVNERHFEVTIEAETFIFRGVKLPSVLGNDDSEQLDERLALLDELEAVIDGLYVAFARQRLDKDNWPKVREAMHRWVAQGTESDLPMV